MKIVRKKISCRYINLRLSVGCFHSKQRSEFFLSGRMMQNIRSFKNKTKRRKGINLGSTLNNPHKTQVRNLGMTKNKIRFLKTCCPISLWAFQTKPRSELQKRTKTQYRIWKMGAKYPRKSRDASWDYLTSSPGENPDQISSDNAGAFKKITQETFYWL